MKADVMPNEQSAAPAKQEKLQAYRAAQRRGVAWLLRQLHDDGSLGHPEQGYHFYRAPWTFAVTGEMAAASAVCGWIRRHMLTSDGRIEGPYRLFDDAYAYRNSALIVGAHMALQYDLSYGLLSDLLSWRDPLSGGFANDRLADGSKSDYMDLPYTCGPGFACLQTGALEPARGVYRYLHALHEAQEELPQRFYYAWSRAEQAPIREFPRSSGRPISWRTRQTGRSAGPLGVLRRAFCAGSTWSSRARSTSPSPAGTRRSR